MITMECTASNVVTVQCMINRCTLFIQYCIHTAQYSAHQSSYMYLWCLQLEGLCRSGCWRQPDHKAVAICQYRLRQHAIAMYKCWLRNSYSGLMITSKRHCMSDNACHIPCALAASWPGPRRNPYPRSIVMDSLPSMVRLPSLAHDMGTAPCIDPCTSPGGDTVMPLVGTAAIPYVGDVRFTSTKLLARSFAVSFACLLLVMLTTVSIMFTSKVVVT